jgi:nucleoside-diphosphate-sugar epimerase
VGDVLVTGANGFVGSHICQALIDSGFRVRALVRKTSDLTNLQGIPVSLHYGSLEDVDSLSEAVEGVLAAVNNAGLIKANNPDDFYNVNARGTENVLNAVASSNPSIKKVIHISSTAACGPSSSMSPLDESHVPGPLTPYGRSKLRAEEIVLSRKNILPVVILRPSAVYGPRDKEMLSFFKCVKFGLKPAFGCSQNYINFTYVKDLARAVVKALEKNTESGSIYFVTEKRSYSYSEAGDIVAGILGRKAHDFYVPQYILELAGRVSEKIARLRGKPSIFTRDKAREISAKYWLFDSSKIEREIGFGDWTDFKTGAAETVAWYKEKGWL